MGSGSGTQLRQGRRTRWKEATQWVNDTQRKAHAHLLGVRELVLVSPKGVADAGVGIGTHLDTSTILCRRILYEACWPSHWITHLIIPIYKKPLSTDQETTGAST